MHYLRCMLDRGHTSTEIAFERKCLEFYTDILELLSSQQRFWCDQDADLQELKQANVAWPKRMALIYRTERFKILQNQKRLLTMLTELTSRLTTKEAFDPLVLVKHSCELPSEYLESRLQNANYFKHLHGFLQA